MSKRGSNDPLATVNFLATIGDQTLDEALANVQLDAVAYGWDRATMRALASRVRLLFARRASK
jgi:hypothetical protein